MAYTLAAYDLAEYLEGLAASASAERGVPQELARHACEVTKRNLSGLSEAALDDASRMRAKAYFEAVIRRASARSKAPGVREYRMRAMAAAVAADLKESGADAERVSREVTAWLTGHQGAA